MEVIGYGQFHEGHWRWNGSMKKHRPGLAVRPVRAGRTHPSGGVLPLPLWSFLALATRRGSGVFLAVNEIETESHAVQSICS